MTTTTEPVVKDGTPADSCAGTSALGALQLATSGNWGGPWDASYSQYEVYAIEGEEHAFGSGYYWELWVNHAASEVGACEAEPEAGQEVLFSPCSETATECPNPLGVEVPTAANIGEAVNVIVKQYNSKGEASPAVGATVAGGGVSATTDAGGHATLTFGAPGEYSLHVTGSSSVSPSIRTEANICVHNGNDGTCGTRTSTSSSAASTSTGSTTVVPSYKGEYALVPRLTSLIDGHTYKRGHAPRVLSGTVLAHTNVTSIGLELRREYRGRCYAFDGVTTRFVRARCGTGSTFKVSSSGQFSYLLPESLPPGRYVLDIAATDAAGNYTTPARGTSRIVFYVR